MDWNRFNSHGEAPTRAFEAFAGILFERWCRKKHGPQLQGFVFVNGAGGDAGVEAYGTLRDGSVVGLQAKWFRERLKDPQIRQIHNSFQTAVDQRPSLHKYIVALPRNLNHRPRSGVTTERDRWEQFKTEQQDQYPRVEIELWDEARLEELLAELGSEGLQRYWFDRAMIRREDLERRYEQALAGWLKPRYIPDLHQAGQIQTDLRIRLHGPGQVAEWRQEASNLLRQVQRLREDLHHLESIPGFSDLENAETLLRDALEDLDAAEKEEQALADATRPGAAFPSHLQSGDGEQLSKLRDLLEALATLETPFDLSPTSDVEESIKRFLGQWGLRRCAPETLRRYGRPVLYLGDPGSGKTHALANAVGEVINEGWPAALLRARELDLSNPLEQSLPRYLGEPGWNLRQLLDALEAAATLADVHAVAADTRKHPRAPGRVLLAFDGLDESAGARRWGERLGELIPLVETWPRILFAVTLRTSLSQKLRDLRSSFDKFGRVDIRKADVPPAELFPLYCQAAEIEVSPLFRWALRSPLELSLFAELYRGQDLPRLPAHEALLPRLMERKLQAVEEEAWDLSAQGWPDTLEPICALLTAVCRGCLSAGTGLSSTEALEAIESSLTPRGVLTRRELLTLMEYCRDRGLLLVFESEEAEEPLWEPAYESLTDYLVACEAKAQLEAQPTNPQLPRLLADRPDAQVLAIALLGDSGQKALKGGLWSESLPECELEVLRLKALSYLPPGEAAKSWDWVASLFRRDMPRCRAVLRHMVMPGLRLPEWPFGARFSHEQLLEMPVAERDLFWSGPSDVPENHGGIWEGHGERVHEELEAAEDDPWDTAPLLLAWMTTTVDNQNRRRLRAELARWGSANPEGLCKLLQETRSTNDPQMREDVLAAAYGASCLTRPDECWKPLAEWVIDTYWEPDSRWCADDVVVRHCAAALVERVVLFGMPIDREKLRRARRQISPEPRLLVIDQEVAQRPVARLGVEPATFDLARHVIPDAIRSFFFSRQERSPRDTTDEESALRQIPEAVLKAFAAREIRPEAGAEAREVAEGLLERRQVREHSEKTKQDRLLAAANAWVNQRMWAAMGGAPAPSREEYSEPACTLLRDHARHYGLKSLTPEQLAFAFVRAFAGRLGWQPQVFRGKPQGGSPGESLGADLAIRRAYRPATHGRRSPVASFGEKYVWLALHELTGYLCDRVPASVWSETVEPPIHPSLVAEIVNPSADVRLDSFEGEESLGFSPLVESIEISAARQPDRANEWVERAPLPLPGMLLLPRDEDLPVWTREYEWVTLEARVLRVERQSLARALWWASSVFMPAASVSLIWEDVRHLDPWKFHEFQGGVVRASPYEDPAEAVWAPWVREGESEVLHHTLDSRGQPIEVSLQVGTCQLLWNSPRGEEELWMPRKSLRREMGLCDVKEGRFLDAKGDVFAYYQVQNEEDGDDQHLLCRKDALSAFLEKHELTLGWATRVYREPTPALIQEGWQRGRFDWYGFSLFDSSGVKTQQLLHEAKTEPWGLRRNADKADGDTDDHGS